MPDNAPQPVLALEAVRFGYRHGRPVVDNITAAASPGRVTALLGPNGAGKSTLLRLMLGHLTPWSGRVLLRDRTVGAIPPAARAAEVAYVPQRAGVSFAFRVREVVAMAQYATGRDPARIEWAMRQCDLGGLEDRIFAELSAGQQQRVLMARAMAQLGANAAAILLDEPSSSMDLRHVHEVMRHLRELAAGGLAVVVVLHDLNLAARYADEVWLMHDGRLAHAGPWSDVLTAAVLEPVYGVRLRELHPEGDRPVFVATPAVH